MAVLLYSVSQKSNLPPKKLFAIFLLTLTLPSVFPWNFINLLPVYIHTYLPILVSLT